MRRETAAAGKEGELVLVTAMPPSSLTHTLKLCFPASTCAPVDIQHGTQSHPPNTWFRFYRSEHANGPQLCCDFNQSPHAIAHRPLLRAPCYLLTSPALGPPLHFTTWTLPFLERAKPASTSQPCPLPASVAGTPTSSGTQGLSPQNSSHPGRLYFRPTALRGPPTYLVIACPFFPQLCLIPQYPQCSEQCLQQKVFAEW